MQELPIGAKMARVYVQVLLLLLAIGSSVGELKNVSRMKTEVFLSPKFELGPGSVAEKYYYNIDFPRGYIAVKRFNAEVVDEHGNSVPLHETYLHHWAVQRYYQRKGVDVRKQNGDMTFLQSDHIDIRNSGVCDLVWQYFGLGSETRHTDTYIPDPYGIEIGNPEEIPEGYEEGWMVNVHAIDTRGAADKLGCTECRCDLYNVTLNGYIGGLRCCRDGMRCSSVKDGYNDVKRGLYLKYTVEYLDWNQFIVPVNIYILDVTDLSATTDESKELGARHQCLFEYDVESCPVEVANDECIHKRSVTVSLPTGGDVIYGVGHQHSGGIGTTLYGEGGREICSSDPTYGNGHEPGNEAGYVVGMSTCYPSPGSVKISAGETLTFVSKYSSSQRHTGVMGLFYLLIADSGKTSNHIRQVSADTHKDMAISSLGWTTALFGAALVAVVIIVFQRRPGREEGYEAITA